MNVLAEYRVLNLFPAHEAAIELSSKVTAWKFFGPLLSIVKYA